MEKKGEPKKKGTKPLKKEGSEQNWPPVVYGSATEGEAIFEEEVVESLLPTVLVFAEFHLAPEIRQNFHLLVLENPNRNYILLIGY